MNETPKTKSGWRIVRRISIGVAVLATLIAIFYAEEDWRGKRAWENCKRELEAKGEILDWNAYIPPPVPDNQNFFTASTNLLLRFKLHNEDDPDLKMALKNTWLRLNPPPNNFPIFDTFTSGPVVMAKIIVSPQTSGLESDSNTLVVAFDDPGAPARVRQLIQSTMGQTIRGAAGFEFSQFQWTNLQPAQIFMQADMPPSVADLAAFVPSDKIGEHGRLRVTATADPKVFQVQLVNVRITSASDYLTWSDQFVPAFDDIREALKRPYAILPGDYSVPYLIPIPNFVTMRSLAQTLAQRAQCYLLLGEPAKALHEMTLIHDVCRILEKPPTGKPETLVEAMINVAITGLYVSVISEGFQRQAWQEPQLAAFQEQLKQINLPSFVHLAFESEPASACRNLESEGFGVLFISYTRFNATPPWGKMKDLELHCLADFAPRGWVYQNMTAIAMVVSKQLEGFDCEHGMVLPSKFEDLRKDQDAMTRHFSPYKFFAAEAIPNLIKAWQTTAHSQTMVNEAQIACALERCRLAHGEYPETLDTLVPQFVEKLPHDIIGGQPLHYRRKADGTFLLYSVGWNERDDGGQVPPHNEYGMVTDYTKGDWVWK